jgi:flagellar motor component MotA
MKRFYVGTVIIIVAIWIMAIITSGGRLSHYTSIPAFVLVVVVALGASLSNYNLREIGTFFAVGFRKDGGDRKTLEKGIAFFHALQIYLLIGGFLGTIVGVIAMLSNLEDTSILGWGMALALLTVLYALLLILIIALPFKNGLKRRLIELDTSSMI